LDLELTYIPVKLLTIFALVVTAAAVILPEMSTTPNVTEVANTQGKGVCAFHLTWKQYCKNGYAQTYVETPGFRNPDGLEHQPTGKHGSNVRGDGKGRWTLNGILASPFVVREFDDPLRLVFEYQGCFWAHNQGNGCGRCDFVGEWSEFWSSSACYWDKGEGASRVSHCTAPQCEHD
jgi:hypothetical protein